MVVHQLDPVYDAVYDAPRLHRGAERVDLQTRIEEASTLPYEIDTGGKNNTEGTLVVEVRDS